MHEKNPNPGSIWSEHRVFKELQDLNWTMQEFTVKLASCTSAFERQDRLLPRSLRLRRVKIR